MPSFAHQEFGNTVWSFAELRVQDMPLLDAIQVGQLVRVGDVVDNSDEANRGAYALAWAEGRLSRADLAATLIDEHMAHGMFHSLSLGLAILDEEWCRRAPCGSALATLEAVTGRSTRRSQPCQQPSADTAWPPGCFD